MLPVLRMLVYNEGLVLIEAYFSRVLKTQVYYFLFQIQTLRYKHSLYSYIWYNWIATQCDFVQNQGSLDSASYNGSLHVHNGKWCIRCTCTWIKEERVIQKRVGNSKLCHVIQLLIFRIYLFQSNATALSTVINWHMKNMTPVMDTGL